MSIRVKEKKEEDIEIFLTQFKKNFRVKERLSVTKTFKHQKHRDLEYFWKKKLERKNSIGAGNNKKKKRGGDCDFTSN